MRNATELMIKYAAYHRDERNIATHFVGIPLIIFSIGVLLARPLFAVQDLTLTPAWILWGVTTLWYLTRGNLMLAYQRVVKNKGPALTLKLRPADSAKAAGLALADDGEDG